jgi:exonuclease III
MATQSTINIAYMNVQGQTGLNISKQVQIENFLRNCKIDILNCQEINIYPDSFENCEFVNSSYSIVSNNASNKYGTCCFVSNSLQPENIKFDTNGRVIVFNLANITFGNVYLPSGNDPVMRSSRENYSAEVIPQLLTNCKMSGAIGGDWNCITEACDATKNPGQKIT